MNTKKSEIIEAMELAQEMIEGKKLKEFNNFKFDVFNNENLGSVRTAYDITTNEVWFVGKDVCDCLGISNSRMALTRLDEDEKMTVSLTDSHSGKRGGAQSIKVVSESGLYMLIMGSRRKEARDFQRWVTKVVLPSIRKNGAYVMGQEKMNEEERLALMKTVRKLRKQVKEVTKAKRFAEADSNYWFSMWAREIDRAESIKTAFSDESKFKKLPNGGVTSANADVDGVWTNKQMFVIPVEEGQKYQVFEREMR